MKRYIYIIIGIIVLAVVAILVLLFIKNQSTPTSGTTGTTGTLPITGTTGSGTSTTSSGSGNGFGSGTSTTGFGGSSASGTTGTGGSQTGATSFGVLSSDPILDYFVNPQNVITAIEPTGAIVTIANGQSTTINSSTINDIISASFSYDGKKVLVNFGDPGSPQSSVFDLTTQTWTALPQGMQSPVWSPSSYQIAYFANTNNGELALAVLNISSPKSGASILLTLHATDLDLQWPMKTQFVISDKPTSQNAGSIWDFNSQAGTLIPLDYETPGAESIWSNNTTTPYGLAFFNGNGSQNNVLQLEPMYGSLPIQQLNFLTLPSKCAFNNEMTPTSTTGVGTSTVTTTSTPYLALYCGIPRSSSGFSSAQLPDAYETMALFTSDDIYKINTVTGTTQALWTDQTQNMDVSDMKLANNALFFVNRYDTKLYGLTFSN
jgi:hypothetical protein